MYIPVEKLIDGVVGTLTRCVLPELGSRYARGQLYAAVDVLQNLRDRVEEKSLLARAETTSIEGALERAMAALRDAGAPERARSLHELLEAAPQEPAAERARALRAALRELLEGLRELPEPLAETVRSALGPHLAAQCVRDVLVRKPSLLREISEG